jgi:mono/diheme cytochrome c family protein
MKFSAVAMIVVCFCCSSQQVAGRLFADDEVRATRESATREVSYKADIRPLLQARCIHCHGEKTRKADLNLAMTAGMAKGGESGPAIVPGDLGKSLLYEKIHSGEMPPDEKDRLSDAEIELIESWIVNGAVVDDESGETASTIPNQHDVIPIMLRRCAACHGRHQKLSDLDLRSKSAMLVGGKSGPAIVLGKPEESLLIKKLHAGEMPPLDRLVEASVKPIEPAEVETLAKWIAAGAPEIATEPDVATTTADPLVSDEDRDFWAFRSPQAVEAPLVKNQHA